MLRVNFTLTIKQRALNLRNEIMMKQSEAIPQRGSYEKVLWKYVANLQENTHIEVQFQLLKSHFSIGVLL